MTNRSSVKCVLTTTDPKTTAAVKQGHTLSLPSYYPSKSYKCGTQALGCIQERRGEAVCRLLARHSHHMRLNVQTVGQAFSTARTWTCRSLTAAQSPGAKTIPTSKPEHSASCLKAHQNPCTTFFIKQIKCTHTYIFFPPTCERLRVHCSPIPKPSKTWRVLTSSLSQSLFPCES